MIEVDARGLSCPLPVVKTKQALESIEDGQVKVIIERPDGRDNVVRFAQSQGCACQIDETDGLFYITITKPGEKTNAEKLEAAVQDVPSAPVRATGPVIVVATDRLGTGSDELGQALLRAFINTLADADLKPAKILFLNAGVRLTTEGSEVLDTLRQLAQAGVEIFSCGTCLDYYHLKDKLTVGVITNMYDTVQTLLTADKVVRI